MSFKRVWTDEAEEIVAKLFAKYGKDARKHIDEALKELKEMGFDTTKEKVGAKINDLNRIKRKVDLSHVADATIRAYKKIVAPKLKFVKQLGVYIKEVYGREGITDYDVPVDLAIDEKGVLVNVDFNFGPNKLTAFAVRDIDRRLGPSFLDLLFGYLEAAERSNADIYNSVFMDRKVFSKMLQGKSISKRNVIKLIIALKLNMQQAEQLLASAGFAFDRSRKMDVVIMFAIEHGIYDIDEIEEALDECGEPTLFYLE